MIEGRIVGPKAHIEIGVSGTDVFDANGAVILHLPAPDDFQLAEPVRCELMDQAYIAGYVEGFNHNQIGLEPKYKEGDTVR